jgi:branched-subunit amino acid ABC-type transport system permease component
MEFLLVQLLNGLGYAMLLFLMAAGLSLIFDLMNVLSLAHSSFFMLGAFLGLAIFQATDSYWLALLLAPLPIAAIGAAVERLFLRRLYQRGHLDQVLLTFGFTFVFFDLVRSVWGSDIRTLPPPDLLQGILWIANGAFSTGSSSELKGNDFVLQNYLSV